MGDVLMKIHATEILIYGVFILIKLTDEPSICKTQLFSFIFINHGHLSIRCLWSSGHSTPKYSILAL